MFRQIAAIAALSFSAAAFTQTTVISPASQQVQLLAPQLVAFAGSTGNFDSLVSGLTQGTPVTLTTVGADGLVQIVTFMPGATLSAPDVARQLETARQNLIVRGVATPSAQQLAVALLGGTLTTASGSTPITGVLSGTVGTTPFQVRNELALLPSFGATPGLNLSATNLQALRNALAQGSPVTLTSTTPTGFTQNVVFTPPGGPMNAFEVNQALQLAAALLAQNGILNPTPDQIQVALLGGNLQTASGATVGVQGVLQGRVRNTSNSLFAGNTSNSPFFGTSNTPTIVVPTVAAPASTTTLGATRGSSTAPTTIGARR
jgi:hypothetical protein